MGGVMTNFKSQVSEIKSQCGLFVGLVTLDLIYLAECTPGVNQKVVASEYTVAAGGPATNAAVAFSYLGDRATVMGIVGQAEMAQLIRDDLTSCGVQIADLQPTTTQSPPISSIIVTQATGERAVVSINAVKSQVNSDVPEDILADVEIVLIDGHQMAVGKTIAILAKVKKIPVVIDGGSWKPGMSQLLPEVDYAICSANFYPPGCHTSAEVMAYLQGLGIPHIAITHGEKPIEYYWRGESGFLDVPIIQAVDTLGAGDVFHGAFCHYILRASFPDALAAAAQIAAKSCQFFGTRRWRV